MRKINEREKKKRTMLILIVSKPVNVKLKAKKCWVQKISGEKKLGPKKF